MRQEQDEIEKLEASVTHEYKCKIKIQTNQTQECIKNIRHHIQVRLSYEKLVSRQKRKLPMSCVIVGNSELRCFMSQYFCAPLKSSVFTADNFLQPETHLMTPPQVYTMLLFCFFASGSSSMLQESLRYLLVFLRSLGLSSSLT